ncbi:hypothetical protein [Pacificibacter marinus]|uniref:HEPN domain-containing protein n=1 Tax=Pacificibacter marinus TaxID=658057 RepID=A0A1Y5TRK4_9RHOB|nr:hypothetical protein [Pacificibacter marinus]SEL39312.1 hypothetical protein SAMN04488032_1245 [Pacificibacter marinus]SLN70419.1 hypothetical protein PAM7971_03776 [Pacificibacter marinus]
MRMTALPNVQILDLAYSYYEAAEVLANSGANAIPIVNLRCHAIELFLKSLYLTDTAKDVGHGVFLLTPGSGRNDGHSLANSFGKALHEHRTELLSDMPDLPDELTHLEGVFQKSRYLYENGDSLPLSKAACVSRFLAKRLTTLPRLAICNDRT